jgi:hypothetical protein
MFNYKRLFRSVYIYIYIYNFVLWHKWKEIKSRFSAKKNFYWKGVRQYHMDLYAAHELFIQHFNFLYISYKFCDFFLLFHIVLHIKIMKFAMDSKVG